MSDNPEPSTAAASPEVRAAQRWNIVWVVPILALLLGAWLVYRNFAAQGPIARVRFETADQIGAAKTEVRCRSVKVGIVRTVELSDDLKSVLVDIEMDSKATHLLRKGTRFWVVKVRFSGASVSGINTVLEGAYIELDPGPDDAEPESNFIGLETPPATNLSVPGRRITLTAEEAGSLSVDAPVYYRGFEVGRIEGRTLSKDGMKVTYNAFIRQEYTHLVTKSSRFWNTSGIDISAGADGVKLRTPSFQAMLSGGVSFGLIDEDVHGQPVPDGTNFILHRDEDTARHSSFNPTMKLLLLFDQTVRGLTEKAPVEYRGITIGRVADISFDLAPGNGSARIPVLIEVDPGLMLPQSARSEKPDADFLKKEVAHGLRAALKTGSLLTGSLFVDLDYYPDNPPAQLGKSGDYITVPTIPSGFAQLEAKLTAILDKVQAMPIDQIAKDLATTVAEAKTTITESRSTLKEIADAAAAVRKMLEDPEVKKLPADIRIAIAKLQKSIDSLGPDGAMQGDLLRTLDELRGTLRSLKGLSNSIEENPKSLIFGNDNSGNTKPKAPRGGR